ncbi:MAG: hypothetical protein P1T08_07540 [Acidimicrobiia bacterium]|nr:hypothetical protein [Acidimicrobiia bacterium]
MTTTLTTTEFRIDITDRALGRNLPQVAGNRLWRPMLVMALMAFPAGVILAVIRSNAIATGSDASTIASLGHFGPAVMFTGFAAVFAAISFAIARILGELRVGGGRLQESTGAQVETLKMPSTARAFIGLMAMSMMILLAAIIAHFVIGARIAGGSASALATSEQWAIWLEGIRRFGVALYLLAIAFGLSTIIHVLRFQSIRVRELPQEAHAHHG